MTSADIEAVNDSKPDFAGFVFASGRHQISLKQAIELRKQLDPSIVSVGVFVNAPLKDMITAVNTGAISIVQLHGDETETTVRTLQISGVKVIQVFKLPTKNKLETSADYLMLDSGSGDGDVLNWKKLKITPDILAGAIDIHNVRNAIETVDPRIIDISRGVETNNTKDSNKIRQIVELTHKL